MLKVWWLLDRVLALKSKLIMQPSGSFDFRKLVVLSGYHDFLQKREKVTLRNLSMVLRQLGKGLLLHINLAVYLI